MILLEQVKLGCGTALLGILDADRRLAYILGEILEMDGDEAADLLGVPPATLRKRLSRARDRVRAALESTCDIVPMATRVVAIIASRPPRSSGGSMNPVAHRPP